VRLLVSITLYSMVKPDPGTASEEASRSNCGVSAAIVSNEPERRSGQVP